MIYKTYAQIKEKVENDLDLQEETFITDEELLGYCNEAIDEAEAEIHKLCDTYFLARTTISTVSGTSAYDLPSDIYANKIVRLVYVNGTDVYEVPRLRFQDRFQEAEIRAAQPSTTSNWAYIITNDAASGIQLNLYPTPQETGSNLKVWYIRNAATIDSEDDEIDIPEFAQFIIQYMKVRCYEKEGHPNLQYAVQELERQRQMMVSTLDEMAPDEDNTFEQDWAHYEEMS